MWSESRGDLMKNRKMKMLPGLPFRSFKKNLYFKNPSPFGHKVEMFSLLWCIQDLYMHLGHWMSLLSSPFPSSVLGVGFGWEVHWHCPLGVEHNCFARTNSQPGRHCPVFRGGSVSRGSGPSSWSWWAGGAEGPLRCCPEPCKPYPEEERGLRDC